MTQQITRTRLLVTLGILLATAALILACGDTGNNTGAAVTGTVTGPTQQANFKVGDQVKVGDTWIVTVNSATTSAGDSVFQPGAGNTYLLLDVSLKNVSHQAQDVSSLAQFTLRDSTGQSYTEALTDLGNPPDGTVAAGAPLRGKFVYEVPKSQKVFTFSFQADITSTGATTWDITLP